MKGGISMIRYFQLSKVEKVSGQCPRYENCRTGRDLPPEFCARYRCNTFYQFDSIRFFVNGHFGPNAPKTDTKEESELSRIVRIHLQKIASENGNSHEKRLVERGTDLPVKVSGCV